MIVSLIILEKVFGRYFSGAWKSNRKINKTTPIPFCYLLKLSNLTWTWFL